MYERTSLLNNNLRTFPEKKKQKNTYIRVFTMFITQNKESETI